MHLEHLLCDWLGDFSDETPQNDSGWVVQATKTAEGELKSGRLVRGPALHSSSPVLVATNRLHHSGEEAASSRMPCSVSTGLTDCRAVVRSTCHKSRPHTDICFSCLA